MTGVVEERRIAPGSKSDMIVTVLVPDDSPEDVVVLRRRSTTTLSADPAFAKHVGKRVTVSGRRSFTSFVVERIEPA